MDWLGQGVCLMRFSDSKILKFGEDGASVGTILFGAVDVEYRLPW